LPRKTGATGDIGQASERFVTGDPKAITFCRTGGVSVKADDDADWSE
jgi:hypothetical protein